MVNHDVISMPDTWEYPWYAAWDLAFHCLPLAMVDPDFAKSQLDLMLSQVYLHPSGQIPAYEWNFGDVNPPVHAFATLFMHSVAGHMGDVDLPFLRQSFTRLLLNFTWWVNRKDPAGKNVFEGGFLGLDNIGVFDRSAPLPDRRPPRAGRRHRLDGAVQPEHARAGASRCVDDDPDYADFVLKFVEHFFWIAAADRSRSATTPTRCGTTRTASSTTCCAAPTAPASGSRCARSSACCRCARRRSSRPRCSSGTPSCRGASAATSSATATCSPTSPTRSSRASTAAACCRSSTRTSCAGSSTRMLDEERFLGPHGIRSISRIHLDRALRDRRRRRTPTASQYEPAESTTGMFGGNSNWRGPVWFPVNLLIIRALLQHYRYYGDDFTIECPTGSGQPDDAVRGRQGDRRPADRHVPARRRRPPAGVRRHRAASRTTRTGAT